MANINVDGGAIQYPKILMVEGKDDIKSFYKLLVNTGVENIDVREIGGKERLRATLSTIKNTPNFTHKVNSLGIILDADLQPVDDLFRSVCNTLNEEGLPVPVSLNSAIEEDGFKVNTFIMPDCSVNGALEDLFIKSISDTELYSECIVQFLSCSERYGGVVSNKAPAYAYISLQKRPNLSFGVSVMENYWNLDHPCFDEIKKFLQSL